MIKIDKDVLNKVPEDFKGLSDEFDYTLTKLESKEGRYSMISNGHSITGSLSIANNKGSPVACVFRGFSTYLQTSPIVRVMDKTEISLVFETEGGVYRLERAKA